MKNMIRIPLVIAHLDTAASVISQEAEEVVVRSQKLRSGESGRGNLLLETNETATLGRRRELRDVHGDLGGADANGEALSWSTNAPRRRQNGILTLITRPPISIGMIWAAETMIDPMILATVSAGLRAVKAASPRMARTR